MSVFMTLRAQGDPELLEKRAASNPEEMKAISAHAQTFGVTWHRFYGSKDGQIMVVDEWPDEESFQKFWAANGDKIQPMMADIGVTSPPEITFWRELETFDKLG